MIPIDDTAQKKAEISPHSNWTTLNNRSYYLRKETSIVYQVCLISDTLRKYCT